MAMFILSGREALIKLMLTTRARAGHALLRRSTLSVVRDKHLPYHRVPFPRRLVSFAAVTVPVDVSFENSVTCRLLCPICLTTEFEIHKETTPSSLLHCERCQRTFDTTTAFYDMTLSSGAKATEYTLSNGVGTSTFQNPFVGFVYERGWRQQFARAGFPGPDREFESAMKFFRPVTGGAIMDLSCGSGLFTRRFLASGRFATVVAVDYSEAMLTQTRQFVDRMETPFDASLHLVRGDVGRLPFPTGSFKAIFAGAAIHCWPNPAIAMAEISRVLSPGGIFVLTTFTRLPKELDELLDRFPLQPLKPLVQRRPARLVMLTYAPSLSRKERIL